MPSSEQLLNRTEKKQPFYKKVALKNFVIIMGKHLCEIFQSNYFEEHLRTAAFGSHLKPSSSIYLTPTHSCEPRFSMFIIHGYYTKSKRL